MRKREKERKALAFLWDFRFVRFGEYPHSQLQLQELCWKTKGGVRKQWQEPKHHSEGGVVSDSGDSGDAGTKMIGKEERKALG